MDKMDLELLKANLQTANAAAKAKKDLQNLLHKVKTDGMQAVLSRSEMMKNAVIMAQLDLIESMMGKQVEYIDILQKVGLDLTEVIVEAKKESAEEDERNGE